jgi:choline dehydrogenase-like flavoprotein
LPIDWAEHVSSEGHWGRDLRDYMSDYIHWSTLGVLCELLPQAENRVTLADEHDGYGLPVAHFSHSLCENDKKNIAYAKETLERIWEAAGAGATMTIDRYAHLVGGARMGFTPSDSVVDSSHRVWGVPNLFLVDGSVFPTEGAANPALVIMALADRCADLLKNKRAA